MSNVRQRPRFSVGNVIAGSLSIYFRNLVPFTLLGAIILAPYFVLSYLYPAEDPDTGTGMQMLQTFLPNVLSMLLTGMLAFGVYHEMRGQRASIGACIAAGLKRFPLVLAVGLVVGVLVFLGFLFLVVPGIILQCMWWVAIPAAVVEGRGIGESMGRSASLTKGHRWPVFGVIFVLGLIAFLFSMMLGFLFVGFELIDSIAFILTVDATSLFFSCWMAVASAVGYHDLRYVKEGVDIESIAAVFA